MKDGFETISAKELTASEKEPGELHFEGVEITPKKPYDFNLQLEKRPIEINDGDELGENRVVVKFERELAELMEQAAELKDIPERERVAALLELVRSKLKYPYPEVIEVEKINNPELADWLEGYFGKNPKQVGGIDANECLERGYGNCKIMAATYLAAAKAANLKGIYGGGVVKNLIRPDTQTPIFKSSELQQDSLVSHAWVEMQLSDGSWMPVDISADMIASNPEMLKLFKDADYVRRFGVEMEGLPKELQGNLVDAYFEPGQQEGNFTARIRLAESGPLNQRKPVVDKFEGNLQISVRASMKTKRLDLGVINKTSEGVRKETSEEEAKLRMEFLKKAIPELADAGKRLVRVLQRREADGLTMLIQPDEISRLRVAINGLEDFQGDDFEGAVQNINRIAAALENFGEVPKGAVSEDEDSLAQTYRAVRTMSEVFGDSAPRFSKDYPDIATGLRRISTTADGKAAWIRKRREIIRDYLR